MTPESQTLGGIRRALLATLLVSLAGTGAELLLLGHVEGTTQLIPLVLIGVALVAAIWHVLRPSASSVRGLQAVMGLCVLSGALGVALHYRGNLEFELEMYPTMSGVELIEKVVTGATPVLAPGTMSLLGLIGLLHAYRHPARERVSGSEEKKS